MAEDSLASAEHELAGKVATWLRATGLPLEMSVARVLRKAGLDVVQSDYFTDPEEGTSREIDVLASRELALVDVGSVSAGLVVECKVAPKPWVMFVDQEKYFEPAPSFERITTDVGSHWLRRLRADPAVCELPLLQLQQAPGYALTTAHVGHKGSENAKDLAYAAVLGATKAAHAIAAARAGVCATLLPVVVIRGSLFKAWLDSDSEVAVEEIRHGQLLWRNPSSGAGPVVVDIVTEAAIAAFAESAKLSIEQLVRGTAESVRQAFIDRIGVF